ncbi:hypothetical protein K488DRAFT_74964 [Vararia minispora EC-137]|uniref:Uncharacterized protein n=1 Tax=Vararia minispora EC-137 TaxID=1314806 RepID=A0ACB8Q5M2_9AGAM|nr:hypothetical protein K488DRAFT_74964 [Vararia minispora EC-137]
MHLKVVTAVLKVPQAPLTEDDFPHDLLLKVNATTNTSEDNDRRIHEARRLEARVLKVASQKTSVEEVTTLQHKLHGWLGADKRQSEMVRSAASSHLRPEPLNCPSGQSTSLDLSVLLRAIISNHSAFSEVTKVAKSTETTLRNRVEEREREVHRLDHQLQRAIDGQGLRADFSSPSGP